MPSDATLADRPFEQSSADAPSRVPLAAGELTQADVLVARPFDPFAAVPAAVAAHKSAPDHADRLRASDTDARVRLLLGRKLAAMMPALAGSGRERVYARAFGTLRRLVSEETVRIRSAIADVLNEMPDTPREIVAILTRDTEISLSAPIIRLSPLLTAEDVLGLLVDTSRESAVAIASRERMRASGGDAIGGGSDAHPIRALLENPSAAIREATLDSLMPGSRHTGRHGQLVRRPGLSARAARALSEIVATDLLQVLAERTNPDPLVSLSLRARLFVSLDGTASPARMLAEQDHAIARARALARTDEVTEHPVLSAAGRGEETLAIAMLAVAAEVPEAIVRHAATLRSGKAVVSLVWKAGFSMQAAVTLQGLIGKLSPQAIVRAPFDGGFPMETEEMRWQLAFLAQAAC